MVLDNLEGLGDMRGRARVKKYGVSDKGDEQEGFFSPPVVFVGEGERSRD